MDEVTPGLDRLVMLLALVELEQKFGNLRLSYPELLGDGEQTANDDHIKVEAKIVEALTGIALSEDMAREAIASMRQHKIMFFLPNP